MGFMRAEMTERIDWLRIETNHYCVVIPLDDTGLDQEAVDRINRLFNGEPLPEDLRPDEAKDEAQPADAIPTEIRDYVGGDRLTAELEVVTGWGVRSSASGYLDATEWGVYDTLEEAEVAFKEEQEANGDGGDEADQDEDP